MMMKEKKTINPKELAPQALYGILSNAVAPRPIAFASTVDKEGNVNLSPFSFFNVVGPNPPTLVFSPVRSMRTLENKHTLQNIHEIKEVCISMVNFDMVEQMSLSSTAYAKGVNEFEKAGFTAVKSTLIQPPFVGESPVSFECVVKQVIETGQEGGAGNLVICEVVMIHVAEGQLDEDGGIDSVNLDLVSRLGGNWYCRAKGDALFEIPKPLRSLGIGVDALPDHVRNSNFLTGNQLGRLGNQPHLPSAEQLSQVKLDFQDLESLHRHAAALLEKGQTEEALAVLYSFR